MSTFIEQFSLVLRQLRKERGWSQEQLAERACLNRLADSRTNHNS
ncbi:helix-turn-helix domain-containing protein [Candidatus Nitrotoga arctica]|nr:helix-turn-helix transcriptional regulator [Candidatus Nitrotoga arctica]